MRERRGFSLIDLCIVAAILMVVAALFLSGRASSRRASNERNASASLKTLSSAEADFRGNDRDGNRIQDFWTRDVAGLYGVVPTGEQAMIKLIDLSVAGADFAAAGTSELGVTGLAEIRRDACAPAGPKAGYWYQRLLADDSSGTRTPYLENTKGEIRADGTPSDVAWWNHAKFGFYAFPDSFDAGRSVFFINEGNTIFKRAMTGPAKPPAAVPNPGGVLLRYGSDGVVGAYAPEYWPHDSLLKFQYSSCSDH